MKNFYFIFVNKNSVSASGETVKVAECGGGGDGGGLS